jgi:hypothetical protein
MIVLWFSSEGEMMKSKVKGGDNRTRGIAKLKGVTVAEGSLQSRAPGYVMPGGPDLPFPTVHAGSMQSDLSRGQRGGAGAQQGGWSARQQAQRMQARGEQDRLGQSLQSGGGSSLQGQPDLEPSDFGQTRGGGKFGG